MAALKVGPIDRNHQYTEDETGRKDGTIVFRVAMEEMYPDIDDVRYAQDPTNNDAPYEIGDRWPGEPVSSLFLCRKVTPRHTSDIFIWEVECEFSTEPLSQVIADPEIEWGWTAVRRALQYDAIGRAILNSAGDSFDPPYERDEVIKTLKVVNNLSFFNDNDIENYVNKVNEVTFRGYPPKTVLCKGITASSAKQGEIEYWRRTSEFHIRKDGWYLRLLDQGYRTKPVNSKLKEIQDATGILLSKPVLLDGEGFLLKDATTTLVGDITAAHVEFVVSNGATVDRDDSLYVGSGNYQIEVGTGATREVMTVLDVTGNVVTVTRGQKGTVAVAHSNGATVKLAPVFLQYEPHETADFNRMRLFDRFRDGV